MNSTLLVCKSLIPHHIRLTPTFVFHGHIQDLADISRDYYYKVLETCPNEDPHLLSYCHHLYAVSKLHLDQRD